MLNLHLDPTLEYYITSDLHIGHKKILQYCNRPFEDIKTMESALITNYNRIVSPTNIGFLVGDLFWGSSHKEFNKFITQLNGIKWIIPGNHDKPSCFKNLPEDCKLLSDIVYLYVNNIPKYVVSHFPLVTYSGINRNCINLHGHIHSGPLTAQSLLNIGFDSTFTSPNHLDIGVDNHNFKPYRLTLE